MIFIFCTFLILHRELVHATWTDSRSRFASQNQILRELVVWLLIALRTVIKSRNVNHCCKSVGKYTSHLVHSASDRTGRIFTMADILQEFGHFITDRTALSRYFVADTPHNDARVIPVIMKHIYHITFRPFIEVAVITIFTFGDIPFIERFDHHHKSHFVTQCNEFGSRHIMRSTDRVASHIFQ